MMHFLVDVLCTSCSCRGDVADCRDVSLTSVPEPADVMTSRRSMRGVLLSNNVITSLTPNTFRFLHWLTTLTLDHNFLRDLPSRVFIDLVNLRHLDLSHNRISSLDHNVFSSLYNLKFLNLNSNDLTRVTSLQLGWLTSLTQLDLVNNSLSDVTKGTFDGVSSHDSDQF